MRIIVDLMGGDHAPSELMRGVMEAAGKVNASFILVGNVDEMRRIAAEHEYDLRRFDLVHTTDVVTMRDEPLAVMKQKREASMFKGLQLLADGEGDAFVSTGNTGALFIGATLIVRKIRGVQRAAIGAVLPAAAPLILLDTGANVVVSEENLEQFAVMGSAYIRRIYGIEAPAVGLLNNGIEDQKGTPLQVKANADLRACPLISYVGNVEASAAPFGVCNVLVTDGFTGNVFLKTMEGTGKYILRAFKKVFTENYRSKLSALLVRGSLAEMKRTFDVSEYGGSPFLGISKPVVKAHGASDAHAFANAIRAAAEYAESGVILDIADEIGRYTAFQKSQREGGGENDG